MLNLFPFSVAELEQPGRDPRTEPGNGRRRDPRRTQHGSSSHRRAHALSDLARHSVPGKHAKGTSRHATNAAHALFLRFYFESGRSRGR